MTALKKNGEQRISRVAIAGFGAIGQKVADRLDQGIPGLRLTAISARNLDRAKNNAGKLKSAVQFVPIEKLADLADIVIECAPAEVFMQIAEPVLKAGKTLVVISVGALLLYPEVYDLAEQHGGRIVVPTGALIGLDAVQAAAEGTISSVRMISRKPPDGLANAPFLLEKKIDLAGLAEPIKLFEGSAREAVRGFPANLNVAAALSLAGIGPDRTMIEIWADPTITRNTHTISVSGDSADFTMTIQNIPSENPKTGRITALSIIAALRKLGSPVCIGT